MQEQARKLAEAMIDNNREFAVEHIASILLGDTLLMKSWQDWFDGLEMNTLNGNKEISHE